MVDLSHHWLNGARTFKNNNALSVRSPRCTGPPPSPVVMVIRRSCGSQVIDYCNPLHLLECSSLRQTLLLISPPKSRKFAWPLLTLRRQSSTYFSQLRLPTCQLKKLPSCCNLLPISTVSWSLYQLGYKRSRFAPLFAALCNSPTHLVCHDLRNMPWCQLDFRTLRCTLVA